jgi:ribose transport system ATP-binding protein
MDQSVLQAEHISKHFGGLQALDDVALEVKGGEVHALVGENGAGKSTFIKILGGIYKRDAGTIIFDGKEVRFHTPIEAIEAGIAIIHQELSMLPHLNVIENVFMGRMPTRGGVQIDWKLLEKRTVEALERVGLHVNPREKVKDLSISQRQLVEIAKALSIDARLIIMDEPNSSLTETETEVLFGVIETLKAQGIAILYVSHKIEEVLRISDRISAFRDGRFAGTINRSGASVDDIIRMMVGRELSREKVFRRTGHEVVLTVKNLTGKGFSGVNFQLRRGEILGFSGLVGAGRSELMRAIFGADAFESGEILFEGASFRAKSPADAIRKGIAMLPEDRKGLSLFMNMSIGINIAMANMPKMVKGPFLDLRKMSAVAEGYRSDLNIRMGSMEDPVRSLSGGNQQKTILGRWLATGPKILILDEPTHGVDIGAKAEIYQLIRNLADSGVSIILISSELPEIITMSDRVVVMHEGCVNGIIPADRMDEETIMACATGCADEELLLALK